MLRTTTARIGAAVADSVAAVIRSGRNSAKLFPEWSERMSKEANAAALSKFAEAVNTGKYELFSDVVASDCVDHDPAPGQAPGPDGYRALYTKMRGGFPDMKVELAERVADEEAIAFAYTFTGTQDGSLMGIAPTGKKVKIRGLQISKFGDGKMVERWGSSDQLGMLQQIGASTIPRS
jgi:steroid delta-isomerase-like uncharacterized protein